MNWKEIKLEITNQLKSEERALSTNRRFSALEIVENIIPEVYKKNPAFLQKIGKESLKKELLLKKKLNSAEIEAINHIYSIINGEQIPIKKRKKLSN